MAVPKKRTSRSKKKIRNNVWRSKTNRIASRAFSLAQSILTGRSKSFYYIVTNQTDYETLRKDWTLIREQKNSSEKSNTLYGCKKISKLSGQRANPDRMVIKWKDDSLKKKTVNIIWDRK